MKIISVLDKYAGRCGFIFIFIGGLLDRIFYHLVYLPSLGKTFDWLGSFNDIIAYYKYPYSWFPLVLIGVGLLLIYLPESAKENAKGEREGNAKENAKGSNAKD